MIIKNLYYFELKGLIRAMIKWRYLYIYVTFLIIFILVKVVKSDIDF